MIDGSGTNQARGAVAVSMPSFTQSLLLVQGGYVVLTGLWPLVHLSSFMAVTGKKTDTWLVRMVGSLASTIGIALLLAVSEPLQSSTVALAVGSGVAFLTVDVVYVLRRTIGLIYLVDAGVEIPLLLLWMVVLKQKSFV